MDWIKKHEIILASKSPRRAQLLREAGFQFEVRAMDVPEDFPDEIPVEKVAEFLAEKKALAQKDILKAGELIIAADSVVILEGIILEKPANETKAKQMLRALSGKKHQVITGVCLLSTYKKKAFSSSSTVFMQCLTEAEMEYYIQQYQPYDKAGSYGIQEWIGINRIDRVEGSYTNIMGLPTAALYEAISEF